MKIHKEGYKTLIFTFLILTINNLILIYFFKSICTLFVCPTISFFLFLFILLFFRNPVRKCFLHENAIIAPADGKIVTIEQTDEPEVLKGKSVQVSIFMNVHNVHVNRYPISGTISYVKHHFGRFMGAYLPKSSTENERTTVQIELKNGKAIVVRQVAGALARRIVCYAKQNNNAQQGDELGFIKFGSRVDLYLPTDTRIDVKLGQKVRGGQTVIGWLS